LVREDPSSGKVYAGKEETTPPISGREGDVARRNFPPPTPTKDKAPDRMIGGSLFLY